MAIDKREAWAFVGDVHLASFPDFGGARGPDGLNERGRLTIQTLRCAQVAADQAPIVMCGDVFHHRKPEPSIIAAAQAALARRKDVLMPGNHDLIDSCAEGGNTACAVLGSVAQVINEPLIFCSPGRPPLLCVPFDARAPMAEVIEAACLKYRGQAEGLATHVGVTDDDTPPWLKDAPDAIHHQRLMGIMATGGIRAAFVGNYHRHQEWSEPGRRIVQVGALNPTGFGDEGLEGYGGLAFWDGREFEWYSVPGPRFLRLTGQKPPEMPEGCQVFVRADRGVEAYEEMLVKHEDDKVVHVELVDPAVGVIEAIDNAKPDRLLESAEDAIREYVEKLPALPEGVERGELLEEVRKYWRQS